MNAATKDAAHSLLLAQKRAGVVAFYDQLKPFFEENGGAGKLLRQLALGETDVDFALKKMREEMDRVKGVNI